MSNSTSSEINEWNKTDAFSFEISSTVNPVDRGFEGLEELLQIIEAVDVDLRPNRILSEKRNRKYSRRALWEKLPEMAIGSWTPVTLDRTTLPDSHFSLHFQRDQRPARLTIHWKIHPFALFGKPGHTDAMAQQAVRFVRAFSQRFPVVRGMGHSWIDYCMGKDGPSDTPSKDLRYQEMYWLNVYGAQRVEELGRERVLSTPASHLEELPGGAVLLLTRPTPADFDSEEARLAQARALVHLHPALQLDTVLATLRHRSLAFSPIPVQFDEDVAPILHKRVAFQGLMNKRWEVERLNRYRPPLVSEWLPVAQAPTPDVEDVAQAINTYEGLYAEQFVALLHSQKLHRVMEGPVDEGLPEVDFALWHRGWVERMGPDAKEALIPALGAWLGMTLVHALGGRWVPRRALEETAVVVGERAWLPFVRARHALQHRDAPLDFSCTQLFRQARRFSAATKATV